MSKPFTPVLGGAGEPICCPYCGGVLGDGIYHSCREMQDHIHRAQRRPTQTPGITLALLGYAFFALVFTSAIWYLGAHVLVSLGVPCPT